MQHKRVVRLGRPLRFPLLVHASWLPVAALYVAHLLVTVFDPYPFGRALVLAAACAGGLAFSVVLHELAHELVARLEGIVSADVVLYPFGGIARLRREPSSPRSEAARALAGPVGSAAVGTALFFGSFQVAGGTGDVMWTLGISNFAIAAVNMIPGLPFDAGHMVRATLWSLRGDPHGALRSAARAGQFAGFLVSLAGAALVVLEAPETAGVVAGLWLIVLGVSAIPLAMGHRKAAAVASALDGGAAGDWVRPFTGRVAMHDTVPAAAGPAAVSDGGRLAGIVFGSTSDRRAAREAMIRWTPDLTCSATDPLSIALERMSATGAGVVVVLDERGVVKGVLTEEAVRDHLRSRY